MLEEFKEWRVCTSAEATIAAAKELAGTLPADCTLALHGGLGAGKTTFVRGIAEAFGIAETITSPSYNIYTIYNGRKRQLIHMDAYRLTSPSAADGLMLEEFMRSPWCWVVEWPENLGEYLPADAFHIYFEVVATGTHRFRVVVKPQI